MLQGIKECILTFANMPVHNGVVSLTINWWYFTSVFKMSHEVNLIDLKNDMAIQYP